MEKFRTVEERADDAGHAAGDSDPERPALEEANLTIRNKRDRLAHFSAPELAGPAVGTVWAEAAAWTRARSSTGNSARGACWLSCSARMYATMAHRSIGGTCVPYSGILPKPCEI